METGPNMFICAVTKKVTEPRVPAKRVVVEKRPATYINTVGFDQYGEPIRKVSHGWEIVREIMVSPEGAAQLEAKS